MMFPDAMINALKTVVPLLLKSMTVLSHTIPLSLSWLTFLGGSLLTQGEFLAQVLPCYYQDLDNKVAHRLQPRSSTSCFAPNDIKGQSAHPTCSLPCPFPFSWLLVYWRCKYNRTLNQRSPQQAWHGWRWMPFWATLHAHTSFSFPCMTQPKIFLSTKRPKEAELFPETSTSSPETHPTALKPMNHNVRTPASTTMNFVERQSVKSIRALPFDVLICSLSWNLPKLDILTLFQAKESTQQIWRISKSPSIKKMKSLTLNQVRPQYHQVHLGCWFQLSKHSHSLPSQRQTGWDLFSPHHVIQRLCNEVAKLEASFSLRFQSPNWELYLCDINKGACPCDITGGKPFNSYCKMVCIWQDRKSKMLSYI